MTVTDAPTQDEKRRHLIRDLCLLSVFAGAVSVPVSPWVSSWFYREQANTWFAFQQDRKLTDTVKLDSIHMTPRVPGKVNVVLNYSQLSTDKTPQETVLCFHVVPEDPANVETRCRELGYNHYDFKPDPPLGTWSPTFSKKQLLSFPKLSNQRATIRLATWDFEKNQATAFSSYSFDFAEFDRGSDGAYADQIASPAKRDLAVYLVTTAALLALIMAFSRLRKPR